jgi:hypothetical protein
LKYTGWYLLIIAKGCLITFNELNLSGNIDAHRGGGGEGGEEGGHLMYPLKRI